MEKLLFLPEVAEVTRIPEATLRYYRLKGIGPKSVRIGSRVRYRESDVKAWIEAQFDQKEPA